MACVSSNDTFISVSCGVQTYVTRIYDNESINIDHTKLFELDRSSSVLIKDSKISKFHEDSEDVGLSMLCSDFSFCGNKLAFCTLDKRLCIVDITSPTPLLLSVHQLSRGASTVKFTPLTQSVLVADKSGDVLLFKPGIICGQVILGHISMVLDVLVTPDENFIITSDRDEKIRVSSFPNAYNIIAYCLGHTEFVSSITLLPHDLNCLISTSGDGTVRLWNYQEGSELNVCNTFTNCTTTCEVKEEDLGLTAITDAVGLFLTSTSSLLVTLVPQQNVCFIIKCMTDSNKQLDCSIIQNIQLEGLNPWKLSYSSNINIIWILFNCNDNVGIKAILFEKDSCTFSETLSENVTKAVDSLYCKGMKIDFKKNVLRLLFKKKFDNLQEYLKKKDARLALEQPSNKKLKTSLVLL